MARAKRVDELRSVSATKDCLSNCLTVQSDPIRLGESDDLGASLPRRRVVIRGLLPGPRLSRGSDYLRFSPNWRWTAESDVSCCFPDAARKVPYSASKASANREQNGHSSREFLLPELQRKFSSEAILNGELAFPSDQVKELFVDAEDIADVAAAALTEDRHVGGLYKVTGPRLLTFREAVDEIAKAKRGGSGICQFQPKNTER